MANPVWPTSLPAPRSDGSVKYAPLVDNVASTSVETGAPKRRRRFTSVPDTMNGTLVLTGAQCTTLNAFVETTLADVGVFDWTDFRSGAAASYVFTKRPTFTQIAGSRGLWTVTLELLKVA